MTKMRYREYVSDNVFRAAGMTRTEFCSMDGVAPDVAEGYAPVKGPDGQLVGWRKNIYSYPPIGSPDGGAYTTVGDLSRFMEALKSGVLLWPTLTREMLTPHVRWGNTGPTEKWMGYGFEFHVRKDDPGEVLCIRKDGVNAGVVCTLRYYPGTDSLIAILGNQECDLEDITRRLERVVLGFETA